MCIKPAWEDMREDENGEEQSKCEQYKVINGDTYEKHEEVKCDQYEDTMLKSNWLTGLIDEKHEEVWDKCHKCGKVFTKKANLEPHLTLYIGGK